MVSNNLKNMEKSERLELTLLNKKKQAKLKVLNLQTFHGLANF